MDSKAAYLLPLLCLLLAGGLAGAADDYADPPDPTLMSKPVAGKTYADTEQADTLATIAALIQAGPGVAVCPPLQCVKLPNAASELGLVQRFVASRALFHGVYAPVEMQLLCAMADAGLVSGESGHNALSGSYPASLQSLADEGPSTCDLTALAQRRQICARLHAAKGCGAFDDSPTAKRYERRRRILIEAKAPLGVVPQPAPADSAPF